MKTMRIASHMAAVMFALPATAWGQDAAKMAQNKLLAKRAAEADAYRKLAETVNGLQITSDTYVKDFVTESDTIRAELDTFIRGVRLGKPKWDSDLACTVPAEVTVVKVIEQLKSVHKRHYKGNILKAEDFKQITRYYKKDIITAYGMGAPRPDLPPNVPGGDIPISIDLPEPVVPDIWQVIGPRARLMATRAASVDAMRRLVERLKGLRITSDTMVRDFVAESDVITAEAQAALRGAHEVGRPYYHHDELIVEVTYEVPVESVITTIKRLHKRHYKGNKVTGMDIEKVSQMLKKQKFQATGMGVPKPQEIKAVAAKLNIPGWTGDKVSATGQGVPRADLAGTPQGKFMAARAAELDAKRNLAEQVMDLQIDSSTVVRDFVTEHDEIKARLNTFIQGSYVQSTSFDSDGTATVVVQMPAMQVWEVVQVYTRMKRNGSTRWGWEKYNVIIQVKGADKSKEDACSFFCVPTGKAGPPMSVGFPLPIHRPDPEEPPQRRLKQGYWFFWSECTLPDGSTCKGKRVRDLIVEENQKVEINVRCESSEENGDG